ncbi:MAG: type 4a pilus biogenesis protein PilO [Planctomycetota bacterium]
MSHRKLKPGLKLAAMAVHGGLALSMVLIGIGIYTLVLTPLNNSRQDASKQVTEIEDLLKRTSEFAEENAALSVKMESIQSRASLVNSRIPDSPKESEFLQQATSAAQDTGVEILDFQRGETDYEGEYAELNINFTIEGSFEGICNFLGRIENLPRISRINKVTMETDSQSETYRFDLSLVLFFTREAPPERIARATDG